MSPTTKAAHTPGPLEASSSIYEHMCAEIRCVEPGKERGIAQVWSHPNGFSDAQLYAAAPDLLAAGKHLSALYGEVWIQGLTDSETKLLQEAWAAFDAAVARAEGLT